MIIYSRKTDIEFVEAMEKAVRMSHSFTTQKEVQRFLDKEIGFEVYLEDGEITYNNIDMIMVTRTIERCAKEALHFAWRKPLGSLAAEMAVANWISVNLEIKAAVRR